MWNVRNTMCAMCKKYRQLNNKAPWCMAQHWRQPELSAKFKSLQSTGFYLVKYRFLLDQKWQKGTNPKHWNSGKKSLQSTGFYLVQRRVWSTLLVVWIRVQCNAQSTWTLETMVHYSHNGKAMKCAKYIVQSEHCTEQYIEHCTRLRCGRRSRQGVKSGPTNATP